jgi:hypothetical protein
MQLCRLRVHNLPTRPKLQCFLPFLPNECIPERASTRLSVRLAGCSIGNPCKTSPRLIHDPTHTSRASSRPLQLLVLWVSRLNQRLPPAAGPLLAPANGEASADHGPGYVPVDFRATPVPFVTLRPRTSPLLRGSHLRFPPWKRIFLFSGALLSAPSECLRHASMYSHLHGKQGWCS